MGPRTLPTGNETPGETERNFRRVGELEARTAGLRDCALRRQAQVNGKGQGSTKLERVRLKVLRGVGVLTYPAGRALWVLSGLSKE